MLKKRFNYSYSTLSMVFQLISNMGLQYVLFRFSFEIKRKLGILKLEYPVNPAMKEYISLNNWKKYCPLFFFTSKEDVNFKKNPSVNLHNDVISILAGNLMYFNTQQIVLNHGFDWYVNPQSGYRYSRHQHWTQVQDYNKDNGDIKYVWEASRFAFLYTIIRNDYHNSEDHSEWVFEKIIDWINNNPLNTGPNYKCSQEISIRLFNWIFALYFYKNSHFIDEEKFIIIFHSIYWQIKHVYSNINFSRKTVRNNHAITETLLLYISGLLFPFFPESKKWKAKGKKWFEDEIEYQIYEDGAHLQFSTNYHRVVVQLLTWAIRLSQIHNEQLKDITYQRAYSSVNFLYQCQEESNGILPNYGSNDGALFFCLSNSSYRDYRPQLDALHYLLTNKRLYDIETEDLLWYGYSEIARQFPIIHKQYGLIKFPEGGLYLIREQDTLTFICCKKHKDRPAHADNMHIDIWHKGENVIMDGGTYQYNTDDKLLKYFMGTESHNTVMINDYDQMYKGPRFIWYNWSQSMSVEFNEYDDHFEFIGKVSCFTYLDKNIIHQRTIQKKKGKLEWCIKDRIFNLPESMEIRQLWHYSKNDPINLVSSDNNKKTINAFYSSEYGVIKDVSQTEITSASNEIITLLELNK